MSWLDTGLLPQGMGDFVFILLLGVSFLSSLITVAFGIGGGAALLAVMATLVPPAALIPTHGVVQIGSNLGRALVTVRHVYWPAIPAFLLGSIVGAGAGGLLVVGIPPYMVQIGVGAFILWSVFGRPPKGVRDWPLLVGAFSSFLTMFFGATGPFVAIYTKSHSLPRHAHVATHAMLMTIQHGVKTVAFGLLGFAFTEWLFFIVAMILFGLAGTLTGRLLLNRMDDHRFRYALNIVLSILAVRLIFGGLQQFIGD
ncbi:sulfite exporter TauE/SafE family protein [Chelativorans salis]|uniref:Probable membrane transporter protein n=1 Tax=Chelativorans salis TaxID=2978478 RepID=A0ABT2LU43_9HYPH|nr:sulfite exporter TauE/SafE family protein [Chelativorans sp. EGI FJ00035]MCT7378037.1 sulfite exporter TauE/SafE family protein [Chelativorans sp. EGI FJ00035]